MFKDCKLIGRVDPVGYHAAAEEIERGHPDYPVSSSALKEFAWCASRWKNGYQSKQSKSRDWGTLLDTYLLTPDLWSKRYSVHPDTYVKEVMECPICGSQTESKTCRACNTPRRPVKMEKPWDWGSKTCAEWRKGVSGDVISKDELARLEAAAARLRDDEYTGPFLESCDTQQLILGTWFDKETGLSIPCRCLIDLLPRQDTEFFKSVGDLKTCSSAHPDKFGATIFRYGYHIQAAWNTDMLVNATGEDRCSYVLLKSENYPPWEPGMEIVSEDYLTLGRSTIASAMSLYARCLKTGKWPRYDDHPDSVEGCTIARPEPWMQFASMSRAMALQAEAEEEEPQSEFPS